MKINAFFAAAALAVVMTSCGGGSEKVELFNGTNVNAEAVVKSIDKNSASLYIEKTTEISFSNETGEQKLKISFDIVVETYQPVFDKTTFIPYAREITFAPNPIPNIGRIPLNSFTRFIVSCQLFLNTF